MSRPTQPQLLERETELRELGTVFEHVLAGRGRAIVIEGAAGTGKSALIGAASAHAERAGLRVLRARGSELEREFAFGAMRQLFEPVLVAAAAAERQRLLAGAAGAAEWVLAPDPDAPSERAMAGFAALNGIYWLSANLAADQPVLVVMDDAHWADASSLRALNFLAGRIADVPVAVLAARRPAEPGAPAELLDELRAQPTILRIALGPLGGESVAHMVRERLPTVDDAVCDACHAASAGNPLYLEELLRTLAANGLLTSPDPAALVGEASVPSLGERVVRRIERVAPDAPRLTKSMAVLGDGGRLSTAASLSGVEPAEAGRIAHRLRRLEVLADEDPFAFVHPLVRRSLYDALPDSERQAAHVAAAELLGNAGASPEAVATHLAVVPPAGSSAVATTLFRAGQDALSQAAPDEAMGWFRRALEEEAHEPPEAMLLAQMGLAEAALRDKEAIPHLQAALERATDLRLRTRIALALAEILGHAGQWEPARAVADRAERDIGDGEPELATEVAAIRAVLDAHDPAFVEDFERAMPRYRELAKRDEWAAHALAGLLAAMTAHRGAPADEVLGLVERALEGGRLLAERGGAWATAEVLGALVEMEALDRALEVGTEVAEAARRDGSILGSLTGICFRAWVNARRGDLASAEADLVTVLDMAVALDMPMFATSPLYFVQDAILERPTLAATAALVEATELDPVFLRTWSGGMLLEVRGRIRVAQLDREAGIADLREAGRIATALHFGPILSSWRSALALALPPEERDEAVVLAAEELELAQASGMARPQGIALRAVGMLEGGDQGIERLRESVSLLEGSEARLEHARSLVELGSALRRAQRRAEARQHLEAGMDLALRCGAERLAGRARDEVRAAGGRPRRMARSGRDSLTASQLRVARMAAGGATNPQIAQELYVSVKTIETHLSHVYAKLGLAGQGSRGRLAEALDNADAAA